MIKALWNKLFKSRQSFGEEYTALFATVDASSDLMTSPQVPSPPHIFNPSIYQPMNHNYTNSLGYSGPLLYTGTTTIPQPRQMRSLPEILVDFTEELYQSGVVLDTLALRDSSYNYLINTVGGAYAHTIINSDYDKVVLRASYGEVKITPEVKHTIKKYSIGYEDVPN